MLHGPGAGVSRGTQRWKMSQCQYKITVGDHLTTKVGESSSAGPTPALTDNFETAFYLTWAFFF